jgi:hypothetical protein
MEARGIVISTRQQIYTVVAHQALQYPTIQLAPITGDQPNLRTLMASHQAALSI